MGRLIAVNEKGIRVGEDHQKAKLTDEEVELIRRLHKEGMSYPRIAAKFEVSHWTVGRICRYERRTQIAVHWKPEPVFERRKPAVFVKEPAAPLPCPRGAVVKRKQGFNERGPRRRLTRDQVLQVHQLFKAGHSRAEIAKRLDVERHAVNYELKAERGTVTYRGPSLAKWTPPE